MGDAPDRDLPGDCEALRVWLAAYVFGALAPDENHHLTIHLAACAACRSERDDLAKVAALLGAAFAPLTDAEPAPGVPNPNHGGQAGS